MRMGDGRLVWSGNFRFTLLAMRSPIRHLPSLILFVATPALGQVAAQTDADHYTRYELLAPGSAKFRIIYEVTATTAGATKYFNPIRRGSIATDASVVDRASGKPLPFDVVGVTEARAGGVRGSDTSQKYIRS